MRLDCNPPTENGGTVNGLLRPNSMYTQAEDPEVPANVSTVLWPFEVQSENLPEISILCLLLLIPVWFLWLGGGELYLSLNTLTSASVNPDPLSPFRPPVHTAAR